MTLNVGPRSGHRRFLVWDRYVVFAWVPIVLILVPAWLLISYPAFQGHELEIGGSAMTLVTASATVAVLAGLAGLAAVIVVRSLTSRIERTLVRRLVMATGLTLLYVATLLGTLVYLFLASWSYDH